ncbi:MAG TPA: cell division protein FtsZ [Alphaproteobacteria bacterium]
MLNLTASNPTDQNRDLTPQITVIGVGGAGCNAVNNMIASKLEGVRFISCNTDAQALKHSLAPTKMQLGTRITAGLGAGSKPDIGRAAAEESIDEVMAQLEGVNMVFITAGMGGGTGTGAAPVIARAAKEAGILTVGVVTKPFHFEGAHRMRMAEAGLNEMQDYVDTLIVIPNQNLFRIANEKTTFADAFKMADSVLQSGVRGVTDLMVMPGLINLDFADIRCAMMEMGKAMMGTGEGQGERKAVEAAERAINNPLLDDISMKGAKGVIINITGGQDMTLFEVDEACNRIRDEVDADANIIFGSTFDDQLTGMMRVTVLATGIETEAARRGRPIRASNTTSAVAPQAARPSIPAAAPVQQQTMEGVYGSFTPRPQHQLYVPPLNNRVSAPEIVQQPVYAQEGATMRKLETGGSDYHQPELGGIGGAAPQETAASAAELSRGVRYGGAFIPPRPVGPEGARAFGGAMPAPQVADEAPAFTDEYIAPSAAPRAPVGLNLNPPVAGARKRQPSLFEKIAGIFSEHDEVDDQLSGASSTDTSSSSGSAGGMFAGFSARKPSAPVMEPQTQEIQAAPVIRQQQPAPAAAPAPQQPTAAGPDLDIPAFLRRQVS